MWQKVRLRLKYGSFDREQMLELLQAVLRGNRRVSAAMYQVMFDTLIQIRPNCKYILSDDMRWKHWIAMTLRYLSCLEPNGKSNTVANVHHIMKHNGNLVHFLLFGNEQVIQQLFEAGLQVNIEGHLPELNSDQQTILDIILYHIQLIEISDRQVGNWTNELLDDWVSALINRLQFQVLITGKQVTERMFRQLTGTSSGANPLQFEAYIELFDSTNLDWAYGLTLGYYNDLKHRYIAASGASSRILIYGFLTAVTLVVMVGIRFFFETLFIFRLMFAIAALSMLIIVVSNMIYLVIVLVIAQDNLQSQLQTLEQISNQFSQI